MYIHVLLNLLKILICVIKLINISIKKCKKIRKGFKLEVKKSEKIYKKIYSYFS